MLLVLNRFQLYMEDTEVYLVGSMPEEKLKNMNQEVKV